MCDWLEDIRETEAISEEYFWQPTAGCSICWSHKSRCQLRLPGQQACYLPLLLSFLPPYCLQHLLAVMELLVGFITKQPGLRSGLADIKLYCKIIPLLLLIMLPLLVSGILSLVLRESLLRDGCSVSQEVRWNPSYLTFGQSPVPSSVRFWFVSGVGSGRRGSEAKDHANREMGWERIAHVTCCFKDSTGNLARPAWPEGLLFQCKALKGGKCKAEESRVIHGFCKGLSRILQRSVYWSEVLNKHDP